MDLIIKALCVGMADPTRYYNYTPSKQIDQLEYRDLNTTIDPYQLSFTHYSHLDQDERQVTLVAFTTEAVVTFSYVDRGWIIDTQHVAYLNEHRDIFERQHPDLEIIPLDLQKRFGRCIEDGTETKVAK